MSLILTPYRRTGSLFVDSTGADCPRANSPASITTEPITIACWRKYQALVGANIPSVQLNQKASTSANNDRRALTSNASGVARVRAQETTASTADAPSLGATDRWGYSHVCAVFESSSSRTAYSNGRGGTANTTLRTISTPDTVNIAGVYYGDGGTPASNTYGQILADVAIWDVALTQYEISALAAGASPLDIRRANLVAYWPLGDFGPVDLVGGNTLSNFVGVRSVPIGPHEFYQSGPILGFTFLNPLDLLSPINKPDAVSTPKTATHSINGALQKLITATHSINAAAQKGITASFSINATLQKGSTATVEVNAALLKEITSSFTIDSAILKEITSVFSIDSALQKAVSASVSLDSSLLQEKTLSFDLDSVLQKAGTVSSEIDGALLEEKTSVFDVNAALLAPVTSSVSIDALLESNFSTSLLIDVALSKLELSTFVIDGVLLQSKTTSFSIDSAVLEEFHGRPIEDVSSGTWLPNVGSDLYATIDEVLADDADYDYTLYISTFEVKITPMVDPLRDYSHFINFRVPPAFSPVGNLKVTLRQGTSTEIAVAHDGPVTSNTYYTYELTGVEADSITDYTDLRFRFEAS